MSQSQDSFTSIISVDDLLGGNLDFVEDDGGYEEKYFDADYVPYSQSSSNTSSSSQKNQSSQITEIKTSQHALSSIIAKKRYKTRIPTSLSQNDVNASKNKNKTLQITPVDAITFKLRSKKKFRNINKTTKQVNLTQNSITKKTEASFFEQLMKWQRQRTQREKNKINKDDKADDERDEEKMMQVYEEYLQNNDKDVGDIKHDEENDKDNDENKSPKNYDTNMSDIEHDDEDIDEDNDEDDDQDFFDEIDDENFTEFVMKNAY